MTNRRVAATVLLAVCVAAAAPHPAFAQPEREETGRIVGFVFDQAGNPLAGVRITATRPGAPARVTYSAPDEGAFTLAGLPPGVYDLSANAPALETVTLGALVVTAGHATEVNMVMTLADRGSAVIVCGCGRATVQVASHAHATEVAAAFLSALPLPLGLPVEDLSRHLLSSEVFAGRRRGLHVDGFSLDHPLTGGPSLRVPTSMLAALESRGYGFGAAAPDAADSALTITTRSGYNKRNGAAAAAHEVGQDLRATRAELSLSGPLVHDHAWYAVGADATQVGATRGGDTATRIVRAAGKAMWQINARKKLQLTTLVNGDQHGVGGFVGVTLEDLLRDNLFSRLRLALLRTNEARSFELYTHIEWYPRPIARTEHDLTLELRGRLAASPDARTDRLVLDLSDRVRVARYFTLTGGLGGVAARTGEPRRARWALTPHLGFAWDVTHDGRSVVRASLERRAPHAAPTDTAAPAPITELAVGAEREIVRSTALGADLVYRRRSDGDWFALTTAFRRCEGLFRLLGGYTVSRANATTAHALRLHATSPVSDHVSLGGLYHFTSGPTAVEPELDARPTPTHEAGVRVQVALSLPADVRMRLFGDGVVAVGGPHRAAFGLQASY